MHSNRLLLYGKYVISNDTELGNIPNGAVVCDGGVIVAVGSYEELKLQFPNARMIGSSSQVVMPGLVNGHGHGRGLSFIQKGYLDTPLELWGERKRGLDPYYDAAFSAIKLIRSGVTTSVVHRSGRNQARLRAFADAGLRVVFALAIADQEEFVYDVSGTFTDSLPSDLRERAESAASVPLSHSKYFELVDNLIEQYESNSRIQIQYGPVSPQWCSTALLERIKQNASDRGVPIHMHLLESVYQREFARRKHGKSIVEYLRDIGFLGSDVTLAHLVWPPQKDIEILASYQVSAVHNPSSNFMTWAGIMPLMSIRSAGITVGLGMDDASLNDDDDMFTEMRVCLRLHRQPGLDNPYLAPHDVLEMATGNGAKCLSLENRIGSLVPGKAADAILVDFDAATYPYIDPRIDIVDALVYRCKAKHVRTTIVDGQVLMQDRQIIVFDDQEIVKGLQASARDGQLPQFQAVDESWADMLPLVRNYYNGWWEKDKATPFYIYNDRM
jgi:5-methylthioadenosine/S-adenosylhomocysteine deaminase